jgi:hypothetical protein
MKTTLLALLTLSLIVWLGAEIFFPIAAAVTFRSLAPDTHAAGKIVGQLLRILHGMGLVSGLVAMAVLALAAARGIYAARTVFPPMILLCLMIAGTLCSQFGIIPAMERDRIAAGGAIHASDLTDPLTAHFDRLHHQSVWIEEAVLVLGLATVVLLARAETLLIRPS